jgi:hypothetical protein
MSAIPKQLYVGTPGKTSETLYTCPAGKTVIIKNIVLTNTDTADANLSLSVAAKNLINAINISPNDTVVIDLSLVLSEGQSINAWQGTDNAINVFISGVEVA